MHPVPWYVVQPINPFAILSLGLIPNISWAQISILALNASRTCSLAFLFMSGDSCFTFHRLRRIVPEHHPHHAFAKVSKVQDLTIPASEQFTAVHPAICNSCDNQIIGIRFKVNTSQDPSRDIADLGAHF